MALFLENSSSTSSAPSTSPPSPTAAPHALRPAMLDAAITSSALSAASAAIIAVILSLELAGIWQSRVPLTKPSRRWIIPLTCGTFSALVLVLMVGSLSWADWHGRETACEVLPFVITNVYVISKQLYNAFLFARAKLVHDALRMTHRTLLLLRRVMFVNAAILPIVAFVVPNYFFFRGKVVPEGNCVFYSTAPALIIIFSVLDAVMGLGLLALFVVPLNSHTRRMAGARQPVDAGLRRMIRFNLRLSIFTIIFDVVSLASLAFCLLFVLGKDVDPAMEHIQVWGMVFAIVSSTVYVLSAHAFTTAWIPVKVKHALRRFSTKRVSIRDDMSPEMMNNNNNNYYFYNNNNNAIPPLKLHDSHDFNKPAYMMEEHDDDDDDETTVPRKPVAVEGAPGAMMMMSTGNSVVVGETPPESAHSVSQASSSPRESQHSTVAEDSEQEDVDVVVAEGESPASLELPRSPIPSVPFMMGKPLGEMSYEEKRRSIPPADWTIV